MNSNYASSCDQLIALIARLSDEQAKVLVPFVTDLVEGVRTEEGLVQVDRNKFREYLHLDRILPDPTITELTGITLAGCGVSLKDQIKAGKYETFNHDINGTNFQLILPTTSPDLVLAHFDIDVTSEEVEVWAKAHDYELALIDELLAYGSNSEYHKQQRKFPVVALGSSAFIEDHRQVPALYRGGFGAELELQYWDYEWDAYYRFLLRKAAP